MAFLWKDYDIPSFFFILSFSKKKYRSWAKEKYDKLVETEFDLQRTGKIALSYDSS